MLYNPNRIRKIKLFCVPFSGGSASAYAGWRKYLDETIELHPLELAGRGRRIREPFPKSFEEAVHDLSEKIYPEIQNSEYALFGHSLGSLLVYELYYKLLEKTNKKPVQVFFSGRDAPHILDNEGLHILPDHEFIQHIKDLGGTPEELFENKELLRFFLPIIRSDYRVFASYVFVDGRDKLDCNISVLYGKADHLIKEDITGWSDYTTRQCSFYEFAGGHFYFQDHVVEVVTITNNALLDIHAANAATAEG
jgi:surfactin synthase thioesterase subunit